MPEDTPGVQHHISNVNDSPLLSMVILATGAQDRALNWKNVLTTEFLYGYYLICGLDCSRNSIDVT